MKLNKDKSIIHLVEHLESRFGLNKIIINDFWEGDLCAIGISDSQKNHLIYISTFNKKDGNYFISIEDINYPTILIEEFDNIEINKLETIISKYLN